MNIPSQHIVQALNTAREETTQLNTLLTTARVFHADQLFWLTEQGLSLDRLSEHHQTLTPQTLAALRALAQLPQLPARIVSFYKELSRKSVLDTCDLVTTIHADMQNHLIVVPTAYLTSPPPTAILWLIAQRDDRVKHEAAASAIYELTQRVDDHLRKIIDSLNVVAGSAKI